MPSTTTRTIALTGPDAAAFANGQFSSDILALPLGRWQWSGWLDPKGRVRALLQVARTRDERFVVVPRGGDAAALAADLKRFVFRAKVTIDVSGERVVVDGDARGDGDAYEHDDVLWLGEGDTSLRIGGDADGVVDTWRARHVAKGFAWLPDAALNALLPPALSMERIGAVAFDKGCFPGQEIAARLHFLGGHKRHLHAATSLHPLHAGDALRVNGRDVGIVLMTAASATGPTTLVVLDDAATAEETVDIEGNRLHIVTTFTE